MNHHQIVSADEWLAARKRHLTREKELTRLRDELSAGRRELPWMKVEKEYVFDAPEGDKTLAGLFEGRSPALAKFPKMPPMPATVEQPAG